MPSFKFRDLTSVQGACLH